MMTSLTHALRNHIYFATISKTSVIILIHLAATVRVYTLPSENLQIACNTEGCQNAATRILSNLDQSADPCDDFFQFTCGGWLNKTPIAEGQSRVRALGQVRVKVHGQVKDILEEPSGQNESVPLANMKNMYKSCINMDAIESRGVQPLVDWMAEISPWPLISPNVTSSHLDLTEISVKLAKYGYETVAEIEPMTDNKHSDKNVLTMDQPEFELPRRYYLKPRNDTYLMAYENHIYRVVEALGLADHGGGRQEVAAMVDLEIALAKSLVPAGERRNASVTYNPMKLSEFHSNYSSELFDFKKYILGVMSSKDVGITDITDDEIVINMSPQYFQNFTEILANTSKTTLANYMIWKGVAEVYMKLTRKFRDLHSQFLQDIQGLSSSEKETKTRCTKYVEEKMGFAIGKRFVDLYVDPDAKDVATEMVSGLQQAFNDLLDKVDWMDDTTKSAAREKNEAITTKIAYPDFLTNATKLEEMYKNHTFSADKYFENALRMQVARSTATYQRLRQPVDKGVWEDSPVKVNAYYNQPRNEIGVPSGILQPPAFSTKYPRYLAYGALGAVIGHELNHGFDDKGSQFNRDGNTKQWWSTSAIEKFKEKKKCFIDQYNSYKMDVVNMTVNGMKTQGENMADNGGLRTSYRAYENWVKSHGKEATLPGLNYTTEQLFFISFGQLWCEKSTKKETIYKLRDDVHSPGRYRIIGPPRNMEEFSEAFNCPRSSYMNPDEKCEVW